MHISNIKMEEEEKISNVHTERLTLQKSSHRHSQHHSTPIRELDRGQKLQKYSTSTTLTCHTPSPTFHMVAPQCTASRISDEKQNRHVKNNNKKRSAFVMRPVIMDLNWTPNIAEYGQYTIGMYVIAVRTVCCRCTVHTKSSFSYVSKTGIVL